MGRDAIEMWAPESDAHAAARLPTRVNLRNDLASDLHLASDLEVGTQRTRCRGGRSACRRHTGQRRRQRALSGTTSFKRSRRGLQCTALPGWHARPPGGETWQRARVRASLGALGCRGRPRRLLCCLPRRRSLRAEYLAARRSIICRTASGRVLWHGHGGALPYTGHHAGDGKGRLGETRDLLCHHLMVLCEPIGGLLLLFLDLLHPQRQLVHQARRDPHHRPHPVRVGTGLLGSDCALFVFTSVLERLQQRGGARLLDLLLVHFLLAGPFWRPRRRRAARSVILAPLVYHARRRVLRLFERLRQLLHGVRSLVLALPQGADPPTPALPHLGDEGVGLSLGTLDDRGVCLR
mmetsp:Transcript_31147/g.70393  ORF Transcript_31147/g.70393 Transcript_31147/m.70393 type:complete len:351 (+) Transcript_31147:1177-2229(+)